jgi:hypothetical protein
LANTNFLIFRTDGVNKWDFGSDGDDNLKVINVNTSNDIFEIDTTSDDFTFTSDIYGGNLKIDNITGNSGDLAIRCKSASNQLQLQKSDTNPIIVYDESVDLLTSNLNHSFVLGLKSNSVLPYSGTDISFNTLNIDSTDITGAEKMLYHDASKDLKELILSSNLTLGSGTLDTVQDIQTTSSPTFEKVNTVGTSTSNYRSTGSVVLQLRHINSSTNSIEPTQTWYRSLTSGTAGNGIGIQNRFWIENDTGSFCNGANVEVKLTDVTTGSCESQYRLEVIANGTLTKAISFDGQSDGSCITRIPDVVKMDTIVEDTVDNGVTLETLNFEDVNFSSAEKIMYHDASLVVKEISLSGNMSLSSGSLDTIQDIQTTSDVQFAQITCSGASTNELSTTTESVLDLKLNTGGTNDNLEMLSLYRNSSSTPESSFGCHINYYLENDNSEDIEATKLSSFYNNVVDSSESAQFDIDVISNGTLTNCLSIVGISGPSSNTYIRHHCYMPVVYNDTISSNVRDLEIDDNFQLGYQSSTLASKTNIETLKDIDFLNKVRVVKFNYRKKNNGEYTNEFYKEISFGSIAEELEKVNRSFCFYNKNGKLAGISYKKFIPILIKGYQDMKSKLDKQLLIIKMFKSKFEIQQKQINEQAKQIDNLYKHFSAIQKK